MFLSEDDFMEKLYSTYYDDDQRNRVASLQRDLAFEILNSGCNVVMDAGFWSFEERKLLREIAKNANAHFELHYMKTPLHILKQRIKIRNIDLAKEFQTKLEDVENAYHKYFQEPVDEEGLVIHI